MPKPALSLDLADEIDQRLARVSTSREIEATLAEADAGVFILHEVMLKWASNLTDVTRSCESDNTSG